jgi:hypothetical protein
MKLSQQGFAEAPAFLLLLLLSTLLGSQAWVWQKRRSELREHHRQLLCLKKNMIVTSKLVKRVNLINQMLTSGKVVQSIALLFPGKGWLLAANWQRVKKTLMVMQEAAYWDAQRDYLSMRTKGCRMPYKIFLTPFERSQVFRRKLDSTVLRKNEEFLTFRTPLMSYQVKWQLRSNLETNLHWSLQ